MTSRLFVLAPSWSSTHSWRCQRRSPRRKPEVRRDGPRVTKVGRLTRSGGRRLGAGHDGFSHSAGRTAGTRPGKFGMSEGRVPRRPRLDRGPRSSSVIASLSPPRSGSRRVREIAADHCHPDQLSCVEQPGKAARSAGPHVGHVVILSSAAMIGADVATASRAASNPRAVEVGARGGAIALIVFQRMRMTPF